MSRRQARAYWGTVALAVAVPTGLLAAFAGHVLGAATVALGH
jgi:hypothetical protein